MLKRFLVALIPLCLTLSLILPLQAAPTPPQPQQETLPEIFGGHEAEPGAWPWQAALVRSNYPDASIGQYCGGTLIAPHWVMTAGHCVVNYAPDQVDVVLGRHLLSSDQGERIAAAEIIVHPTFNYNPFSYVLDLDGDIALIRLTTPSTQQPITLFAGAAGEEENNYSAATVTGWGLTDQFTFPDALQEVMVPFVTPSACSLRYGSSVTENMICAGYPKGRKDACYGDSGGPLIVHDQEQGGWRQIGIVSWGSGCGLYDSPGVYTRVASYREWVNACLAGTASQQCTGADSYEPDNGPQQATLIMPLAHRVALSQSNTISQTHQFHTSTDRDWIKFEAQTGSSYRIDIQPLGTQSDPLLWLYDSNGITPLAYDDDSGEGSGAALLWHATGDGLLFVEVQDAANGRGDETAYSVVIQQVLPVYLPVVSARTVQPSPVPVPVPLPLTATEMAGE
jgi:secreted trypsin-like serine protease